MNRFQGFPDRMEFTSVPNVFFSGLLPDIDDIAELKVTLHVLALMYRKRGYPRFVTCDELAGDLSLMRGLPGNESSAGEVLRHALEAATERGTLLHLVVEQNGGGSGDVYFLNDEPGRQALARVESGEITLTGFKTGAWIPAPAEPQPDIFTLYEQNIGLLTPMTAEQLRDAEKNYPESWIRDAVKEAVNQNKRKWGYIAAILERWSTEGKTDGTYQRDTKKTDPDRFVKGKYGHVVRRR
jgi:DNA replication protein